MIREYFESSYSNKQENQEEMDKFLATMFYQNYQENINNLNRSIMDIEIEIVKKKFPKKRKAQDWMDSLLNSTRPIKKS
jgi:hypothetical protein